MSRDANQLFNIEQRKREYEERQRKSSARTSFSLSEEALDAVKYLLKVEMIDSPQVLFDMMTNSIAVDSIKKTRRVQGEPERRSRKSFVISNGALFYLNETAKDNKISRDLLVERLLTIAWLSFEEENQRRLERQKKAKTLLDELLKQAYKMESAIGDILGADDPVKGGISGIVTDLEILEEKVGHSLNNSMPIITPVVAPNTTVVLQQRKLQA